tara:strand:- start:110 stop:409 length:300 start_codon:yes stop_codon:yes gene_type:complete
MADSPIRPEKTSDELALIYKNAADSVNFISKDISYAKYMEGRDGRGITEDEWKDNIKRNVEHLEIVKNMKKNDNKTSVWTSESFTDIDAAITKGKKLYA